MISADSPLDPRRSNRGEETVIDGHETHWYRGEIASAPDAQVRETLIELDDGRVAHISLRAASAAELADALQQAQTMRSTGPQLHHTLPPAADHPARPPQARHGPTAHPRRVARTPAPHLNPV